MIIFVETSAVLFELGDTNEIKNYFNGTLVNVCVSHEQTHHNTHDWPETYPCQEIVGRAVPQSYESSITGRMCYSSGCGLLCGYLKSIREVHSKRIKWTRTSILL